VLSFYFIYSSRELFRKECKRISKKKSTSARRARSNRSITPRYYTNNRTAYPASSSSLNRIFRKFNERFRRVDTKTERRYIRVRLISLPCTVKYGQYVPGEDVNYCSTNDKTFDVTVLAFGFCLCRQYREFGGDTFFATRGAGFFL